MGNHIVQDLISNIGQYLHIDHIFRIASINKLINTHIKQILWTHDIVNLQFFDCQTISDVFHTYKFTQVDLSNTMITDSAKIDFAHITTCIMKNCFCTTDEFVMRMLKCNRLDLTNCIGIRGHFINSKPSWNYLKLSGCFFLDINHFIKLGKCDTIDLRGTILALAESGNANYTSTLKHCTKVFATEKFEFEPVIPPSIAHICHYYKTDTKPLMAKMLVRLYIRDRQSIYLKALLKYDTDAHMADLSRYPNITEKFTELIRNAKIPNILLNKLFFRVAHDTDANRFCITKDPRITSIGDYYYDSNLLNDMINNNYFIRVDTKLQFVSGTEFMDMNPIPIPISCPNILDDYFNNSDFETVCVKKIPINDFNSYLDANKIIIINHVI